MRDLISKSTTKLWNDRNKLRPLTEEEKEREKKRMAGGTADSHNCTMGMLWWQAEESEQPEQISQNLRCQNSPCVRLRGLGKIKIRNEVDDQINYIPTNPPLCSSHFKAMEKIMKGRAKCPKASKNEKCRIRDLG